MPYSICPRCGHVFHLLIAGDKDEWYAEFAPGKKYDEEVHLECFKCWKISEHHH
jgi:hypothetical protein